MKHCKQLAELPPSGATCFMPLAYESIVLLTCNVTHDGIVQHCVLLYNVIQFDLAAVLQQQQVEDMIKNQPADAVWGVVGLPCAADVVTGD